MSVSTAARPDAPNAICPRSPYVCTRMPPPLAIESLHFTCHTPHRPLGQSHAMQRRLRSTTTCFKELQALIIHKSLPNAAPFKLSTESFGRCSHSAQTSINSVKQLLKSSHSHPRTALERKSVSRAPNPNDLQNPLECCTLELSIQPFGNTHFNEHIRSSHSNKHIHGS